MRRVLVLLCLSLTCCQVNRAPMDQRYAARAAEVNDDYTHLATMARQSYERGMKDVATLKKDVVPVDAKGFPIHPVVLAYEQRMTACSDEACIGPVLREYRDALTSRYYRADFDSSLAEIERVPSDTIDLDMLEAVMARDHNAAVEAHVAPLEQMVRGHYERQMAQIEQMRSGALGNAAAQRDSEIAAAEANQRRALGAALQSFGQSMQRQPAAASSSPSNGAPASRAQVYQQPGCTNDYACGIGYTCVKPNYSTSGTCMKSVNEYGTPNYSPPSADSVGVKTPSVTDCRFNTDCPIGFRCDTRSGACIQ